MATTWMVVFGKAVISASTVTVVAAPSAMSPRSQATRVVSGSEVTSHPAAGVTGAPGGKRSATRVPVATSGPALVTSTRHLPIVFVTTCTGAIRSTCRSVPAKVETYTSSPLLASPPSSGVADRNATRRPSGPITPSVAGPRPPCPPAPADAWVTSPVARSRTYSQGAGPRGVTPRSLPVPLNSTFSPSGLQLGWVLSPPAAAASCRALRIVRPPVSTSRRKTSSFGPCPPVAPVSVARDW